MLIAGSHFINLKYNNSFRQHLSRIYHENWKRKQGSMTCIVLKTTRQTFAFVLVFMFIGSYFNVNIFYTRFFHFLKEKQENNGKITSMLLLISLKIIFHYINFSCYPFRLKLNKCLACFSQRMLSVLILENWMGKNCKEDFHSVLACRRSKNWITTTSGTQRGRKICK